MSRHSPRFLWPGSSPLARGLHRAVIVGRLVGRIIPARAGFTSGGTCRRCNGQDHPRSRGVYLTASRAACALSGSSPLARGLPSRRKTSRRGTWIIPARAGFTQLSRMDDLLDEDHPRSRGVYPTRRRARTPHEGSSPLARGLPYDVGADRWGRGIIPARAGFTLSIVCTVDWRPDHPRSRGVYGLPIPVVGEAGGSSPLARGLPVP